MKKRSEKLRIGDADAVAILETQLGIMNTHLANYRKHIGNPVVLCWVASGMDEARYPVTNP
jgi:hypothetical protein